MASESTATYRFGDLIALARQSWLGQMTSRLERLGYAGYRRGDSAVLPMLRRDPLPVGQLGAGLGVTRQAARKVADGLEQRGYATTERDSGDTRQLNVTLTQLGRDYARAVTAVVEELNREVAGRVSPDQRQAASQPAASAAGGTFRRGAVLAGALSLARRSHGTAPPGRCCGRPPPRLAIRESRAWLTATHLVRASAAAACTAMPPRPAPSAARTAPRSPRTKNPSPPPATTRSARWHPPRSQPHRRWLRSAPRRSCRSRRPARPQRRRAAAIAESPPGRREPPRPPGPRTVEPRARPAATRGQELCPRITTSTAKTDSRQVQDAKTITLRNTSNT
jgi:DNA-binding MarR family transcriptional regulator